MASFSFRDGVLRDDYELPIAITDSQRAALVCIGAVSLDLTITVQAGAGRVATFSAVAGDNVPSVPVPAEFDGQRDDDVAVAMLPEFLNRLAPFAAHPSVGVVRTATGPRRPNDAGPWYSPQLIRHIEEGGPRKMAQYAILVQRGMPKELALWVRESDGVSVHHEPELLGQYDNRGDAQRVADDHSGGKLATTAWLDGIPDWLRGRQ